MCSWTQVDQEQKEVKLTCRILAETDEVLLVVFVFQLLWILVDCLVDMKKTSCKEKTSRHYDLALEVVELVVVQDSIAAYVKHEKEQAVEVLPHQSDIDI